jgi:hypothetical protein
MNLTNYNHEQKVDLLKELLSLLGTDILLYSTAGERYHIVGEARIANHVDEEHIPGVYSSLTIIIPIG